MIDVANGSSVKADSAKSDASSRGSPKNSTYKNSSPKSLPWPLLEILADGSDHSGQRLGEQLGVSRAAIWKMVQQLESAGVVVESQRGAGYRLRQPIELLSADRIRAKMNTLTAHSIRQLSVVLQTDSTNSAIASNDYQDGDALFAEWQLAGRGRRGRQWISPPASNLYFSVRWGFSEGVAALEGLSLAVGLALAEGLQDLGIAGVELKWPNDLWLDDKKLGGILIEIAGDVAGECHAIVGVGLNVVMPLSMNSDIDQAWTDLSGFALAADRNQLAAALLNRLIPLLESYQRVGFAHYRQAWLGRNALKGRYVEVSGAQALTGHVVGVSENGALLVLNEQGEHVINGGEVSVRAQ